MGCIYGLVALGFVLIYKATELVNFAQGDLLMLGAFVSQNAPSLMETRAYPDRLVRWTPGTLRRHPFEMRGSYLALALAARRVLPAALVNRLLPGEPGTLGREPELTDWDAEYGAQ